MKTFLVTVAVVAIAAFVVKKVRRSSRRRGDSGYDGDLPSSFGNDDHSSHHHSGDVGGGDSDGGDGGSGDGGGGD